MEPFYLIVLGIAVVFFILVLTGIGLMMRTQNQSTTFPPNANTCPDGWIIDASGLCNIPQTGNLGGLTQDKVRKNLYSNNRKPLFSSTKKGDSQNNFDPNDPAWISKGKTQICAQKTWASSNNISWDGISNYNSCS